MLSIIGIFAGRQERIEQAAGFWNIKKIQNQPKYIYQTYKKVSSLDYSKLIVT